MSKVNLQSIKFDKSNITFVDGLTLEKIKFKYNWILNANIRDAIIGENDRGIVWYSGDWLCGEWIDGTWYSGNFYEGVWNDGLWYSYEFDKFDLLNQKFFIKQESSKYSQFHNGVWKKGDFYNGTFGENNNESWTNYELYYDIYPNFRTEINNISGNIIYDKKKLATWIDGTFHTGLFYDSIWVKGNHLDGIIKNSKWLNGKWFNGTFDGNEWFDGYWYNGDFIKGSWRNGVFTQYDKNIISTFGNTKYDTDDLKPICIWYDGTWIKGEWYSGYRVNSDNKPIESNKNYLSVWYNGTWKNGTWYGGHFYNGTWENGVWYNGIFGSLSSTNWSEPELVSNRSDVYDLGDVWSGDTAISSESNADLVTSSNSANTQYEWIMYLQEIEVSGISIDTSNSSITFSQSEFYNEEYQDFNNNMFLSGITGYNFEELFYNNNMKLFIKYNNTATTYNVDSLTATTSAYTWNVIISNDWYNYEPVFNEISAITFIIKRNVSLKQGNGSGDTYLYFNSISSTNFNVSYESNIEPSFNIGDLIYVEQNKNSTNSNYNGVTKILNIEENGGIWKITTTQKFNINSNDNGKIVNYLQLQKSRNNVKGPSLYFQNFDFDFGFIENTATTLATGYLISYETNLDIDDCTNQGFYYGDICLPWKGLYFKGITNLNYNYDINYDIGSYLSEYYNNSTLPIINGCKSINKFVTNNLDNTNRTNILGGFNDLWGLVGLEQYYPSIDPINSASLPFNQDEYNIQILKYINEKMRVSINFLLKNNISQRLYLKNIKVKVYYSNNNKPQWLKGTWHKGTWYNGDFYDGLFKSGMWINGDFYNGNLSSNYR